MARLLCTIFLISGASALMFETLWFRQAGLAFGNSVWASSLVLSGFMAGLAMGNAIAARAGSRILNPIRLYALLELVIGIGGLLLVIFLPRLGEGLAPWFLPLLDRPWLLNPLRLFLAFFLLLIPSTAMGITLPLLTKALSANDPLFGRVLGRLYGWNTTGALLGVILTEFVLIGALGVRVSAGLACFLNVSVAAAAWHLSKSPLAGSSPATSNRRPSAKTAPSVETKRPLRYYLTAAFLSGFCLLALEVLWFRFLMLFVSGHSESFALMLAVVLGGIAFGGLIASFALKRRPSFAAEGAAVVFLMGVLTVLSYALFPFFIAKHADAVITSVADILSVGIPLMLPVSWVSGIFFTIIGTAIKDHLDSETAATGALTFANTLGAAFGAFSAGFVLLPHFGMERGFFFIAALYGLTGLLLFGARSGISRTAAAAVSAFALGILFFPTGAMETRYLPLPSQRLLSPGEEGRIVAVREGQIETISYLEQQWKGQPLSYRLVTNSYSMSRSDILSKRYMKLFVYLPMAIHPDPKYTLLISYGIGSTAKALTEAKGLERIDVVDISKDILEMNDIVFPNPAGHPLRDPRVRVHIEDARYFLQTTAARFDLITGEPPPPELAGVVNLYTEEYFRLLYDRLNPGGIVSYWLPLHAIDAESAKAILKAFCKVFSDCSLWHGQMLDLIMIGTREAQGPVSESQFRRQWEDPLVSKALSDIGIEIPEQLGALFIGDASYLEGLTRGTWPLVDNFPKRIAVSRGPRMELVKLLDRWTDTTETQQRFLQSPLIRKLWPERLRQDSVPYFEYQALLHQKWFGLRQPMRPPIADLHQVLTETPLKTLPLWLLGSDADYSRIVSIQKDAMQNDPIVQARLGMMKLSERDYEAAAAAFARAEADPKVQAEAFNYRVYALSMAGQIEQAQRLVAEKMGEFLAAQKKEGVVGPPPLSPFWDWMKKNRGLDPFAILHIE